MNLGHGAVDVEEAQRIAASPSREPPPLVAVVRGAAASPLLDPHPHHATAARRGTSSSRDRFGFEAAVRGAASLSCEHLHIGLAASPSRDHPAVREGAVSSRDYLPIGAASPSRDYPIRGAASLSRDNLHLAASLSHDHLHLAASPRREAFSPSHESPSIEAAAREGGNGHRQEEAAPQQLNLPAVALGFVGQGESDFANLLPTAANNMDQLNLQGAHCGVSLIKYTNIVHKVILNFLDIELLHLQDLSGN